MTSLLTRGGEVANLSPAPSPVGEAAMVADVGAAAPAAGAELAGGEVEGGSPPAGEAGGEVAGGEAPATEEKAEAPSVSARLFDKNAEQPAWMQALDYSKAEVSETDLAALEEAPLAVQRVVHAARKEALAAQETVAAQIAELKALKESLGADQRKLLLERGQLGDLAPSMKAFLDQIKPEESADVDPFSKEGIRLEAQKEAYRLFELMQQSLQKTSEEKTAELQRAEEAHEIQLENAALNTYMDAHAADFDDVGISERIREMVGKFWVGTYDPDPAKRVGHAHPEMTVQRAHQLVRAQLAVEGDEQAADKARAASKRLLRRGGRAAPAVPATPKGMGGQQLMAWYARHPGAQERDEKSALRRSSSLV